MAVGEEIDVVKNMHTSGRKKTRTTFFTIIKRFSASESSEIDQFSPRLARRSWEKKKEAGKKSLDR